MKGILLILAGFMMVSSSAIYSEMVNVPGQGSIDFQSVDDPQKPTTGVLTKNASFVVPGQGTYLFKAGETVTLTYYKVDKKLMAVPLASILAKDYACVLPGQGSYSFMGDKEIEFYYTNFGSGSVKGYFQFAYLKKDSTFSIPGQGSIVFSAASDMTFLYKNTKGKIFTYVITGSLKKDSAFQVDGQKKKVAAGTEVNFEYAHWHLTSFQQ